jgi:hypothetical protein
MPEVYCSCVTHACCVWRCPPPSPPASALYACGPRPHRQGPAHVVVPCAGHDQGRVVRGAGPSDRCPGGCSAGHSHKVRRAALPYPLYTQQTVRLAAREQDADAMNAYPPPPVHTCPTCLVAATPCCHPCHSPSHPPLSPAAGWMCLMCYRMRPPPLCGPTATWSSAWKTALMASRCVCVGGGRSGRVGQVGTRGGWVRDRERESCAQADHRGMRAYKDGSSYCT